MKILYGVNGEGMGHAMRSAEIIKNLSKDHEIKIIAGGKAADYLKKFNNLKKVNYLSFVTKNGKIYYFKTALFNLLQSPILICNFFSILIKSIFNRPNLIITDFEPLTSYTSLILRIPLISFDNQHIVTDTQIPVKNPFALSLYKTTVSLMTPFPKKKVITTFFYPKLLKKNSVLVPPVIREIIAKQKPRNGKHLLVYLGMKNDSLLSSLNNLKIHCIVYGKTSLKSSKYLKMKKFDEYAFAADLANSKAVICNAGLTTLTESLYLKKPILCIPLKGQVEQELNAYYLKKYNYGLSTDKINSQTIKKFLNALSKYKAELRKVNFSNIQILQALKKIISQVT